jgi:hypothetical protein
MWGGGVKRLAMRGQQQASVREVERPARFWIAGPEGPAH